MSNYFNYPEITLGNETYIMYSAYGKTYYFKEYYKLGFENFSEEKLTEFASFVFKVVKSKFDIEERFLIKTGVV
jgi:hypothetical protein